MDDELTIRDVMGREYVGVSESDTVLGAVQLMREERTGSVVVLRGSDPVGIVTEWDVLELVADGAEPEETTVGDVMSTPVVSMPATRRLGDAAETMARHNIRRMVVEDDGEITGILTERDIIAASASLSGVPVASSAVETPEGSHGSLSVQDSPSAEYSTQSICESCGSLAQSLAEVDGQLLCPNCQTL